MDERLFWFFEKFRKVVERNSCFCCKYVRMRAEEMGILGGKFLRNIRLKKIEDNGERNAQEGGHKRRGEREKNRRLKK